MIYKKADLSRGVCFFVCGESEVDLALNNP